MWPYLLLLTVILLLQIKIGNYDNKNCRYYIGIVIIFLFAALRGNGSGDYFAYLGRGDEITTVSAIFNNNTHMEIGYAILSFFRNKLQLHPQFVIMAMNFISIFCIHIFIKRYSKNWSLSLLLFLPLFYQFDMHAARTAVAISISTLAVPCIIEKKLFKFIFVIAVAMLFHRTAAVMLPIYFFARIKMNLFTGAMFIAGSYFIALVTSIDALIINVLGLLNLDYFVIKYSRYATSLEFGYPFKLYDPRLLLAIGIFIIAKIILKKPSKLENIMTNCCFINAMILIVFSEHTFVADRLASFYSINSIILLPLVLRRLKQGYASYRIKENLITLWQNSKLSLLMTNVVYVLYSLGLIYTCFYTNGINYLLFKIYSR